MSDNDEFITDLQKLIDEENAIALQPGDVTVGRVMRQSGRNRHLASRAIQLWVQEGRLVSLGKRRDPSSGLKVDAWKIEEEKCTKA